MSGSTQQDTYAYYVLPVPAHAQVWHMVTTLTHDYIGCACGAVLVAIQGYHVNDKPRRMCVRCEAATQVVAIMEEQVA